MNMVKAFVSAANTYRDGTYGAHAQLYLTAVATSELRDAPQNWGSLV